MIDAHLPVLLVIVPLFGGLISVFCGQGLRPWLWSTLITFATFALALRLLETVHKIPDHTLSYALGWWPYQYGIEYRIDLLNAYVICVVAAIGFLATVYAKASVQDEIPSDRHHLFYSVWLLAIAGLLGISATGDTFNVYVLLEISSLTVYCLIGMGGIRDRRAYVASLKYLILGSIGATFILLGIGYLLMLTGTLNMADMHHQLAQLSEHGELAANRTLLVAFAFLMTGFALKMALFPLHTWLPNAYTFAPSAVSVLISATATKVGVYMAFRFVFTIFGGVYDTRENFAVFLVLACAGVIVSSLRAIQQHNVKQILAYSSVGQLAYIVLGFSLMNRSGISAALIHICNHAVIKGGMFMAVGCVALRMGGTDLRHFAGLGRKMPWTMAAFTAGGLGLIGVPLTGGFVSKWYLVRAAFEAGQLWILAIVLIGGLLALIYTWRVIEVIYFRSPPSNRPIREAPLSMLIPTWVLIGASLYLGVNAEFTSSAADEAASQLFSGTENQ